MPHYLDSVINQYGRPVPNVLVTVYLTGTTNLATIYSDELITLKNNPFNADSKGMVSFFAVTGDYDLLLSGGSPAIDPVTYTISTGFAGAGLTQSKVLTTGSIPAGGAATITVTWDVPFSNANYKVAVNLLESGVSPGAGGLRYTQLEALTTTNIKVRVVNDDPDNAHTGTLYAMAF